MLLNKKIQSYTLSEIIVVLVLTSIVVGLAFSVLQLIQKQMTALRYNNEQSLNIKSLETKLNILFHQSEQIQVDDSELIFIKQNDILRADFGSDAIIIEKDSIALSVFTINTFYKGEEKTRGEIDAISIDISIKKDLTKPIFVYKTNDAKSNLNEWE